MRIKASDIEKIFLLKSVSPFDKLNETALSKLVEVMHCTKYNAGTLIYSKDQICAEVLVSIDGTFTTGSGVSVTIVGIHSVLEDIPVGDEIIAGQNGVSYLRIGKGHFLTMIYEFPFILTDLIEISKINPSYYL